MEVSHIIQSPPIRKISNSSLQFKQLIQSLRKRPQPRPPSPRPLSPTTNKPEPDSNHQVSTVNLSEQKTFEQTNNFMTPTQSEGTLKVKPKMEVGDRDKLKKKLHLDHNPEVQMSLKKDQSTTHIHNNSSPLHGNSQDYISIGSSPKKNASTQYDGFQMTSDLPSVFQARSGQKMGQIIKQVVVKPEELNEYKPLSNKNIRDINQKIVLNYLQKETKVQQKSDPSEIFNFFTNLCLSCDIIIKNPSIKKYKNCVYFGHSIKKDEIYEGFLYFYDGRIYYGEFLNGFKHGLGVELTPNEHLIMKGQFKDGHKTGKFYLEKPNQKYIGFLENGLYDGQGRLTTEDYVYEGLFEKGEKNGYGEEFYPKTGVKISGMFRNGILQKKPSKSIPQIRAKHKILHSKDKTKSRQRLELIRKKSLEKHNNRMNKIRNPTQRQSQYQIQFETNEDYQQPQKLQVNSSKLEMYRQPPQKLPKICQQFEYSFESGRNFESISSHHDKNGRPASKQKRQYILGELSDRKPFERRNKQRIGKERVGTSELEDPLPTPCLTVYKRRR